MIIKGKYISKSNHKIVDCGQRCILDIAEKKVLPAFNRCEMHIFMYGQIHTRGKISCSIPFQNK